MYYQVALNGGQTVTIFHDLLTQLWWEQTAATPVSDSPV